MRKQFEMSQEELDALLNASQPVPYLIANGTAPRSPQQNANDAWNRLGSKLGFDHMTVQPVSGKGMQFFTAEELQ